MTIELDKDALSAARNALLSSGVDGAIRAYLTAIRQPQRDAVVKAAKELISELTCTLALYHANGPDYTFKDGTQVFDVSVTLEREDMINGLAIRIAALDATP